MPFYEHTFIARPDLSGQQAQSLAEELSELLVTNGAEVKKTEYWGLRTLAFRGQEESQGPLYPSERRRTVGCDVRTGAKRTHP